MCVHVSVCVSVCMHSPETQCIFRNMEKKNLVFRNQHCFLFLRRKASLVGLVWGDTNHLPLSLWHENLKSFCNSVYLFIFITAKMAGELFWSTKRANFLFKYLPFYFISEIKPLGGKCWLFGHKSCLSLSEATLCEDVAKFHSNSVLSSGGSDIFSGGN